MSSIVRDGFNSSVQVLDRGSSHFCAFEFRANVKKIPSLTFLRITGHSMYALNVWTRVRWNSKVVFGIYRGRFAGSRRDSTSGRSFARLVGTILFQRTFQRWWEAVPSDPAEKFRSEKKSGPRSDYRVYTRCVMVPRHSLFSWNKTGRSSKALCLIVPWFLFAGKVGPAKAAELVGGEGGGELVCKF